jgi:hypothetical protein
MVPERLVANCEESPERMVWLEQLPTAVHELERLRSLTRGTPFGGPDVSPSWVAPVRRAVASIGSPGQYRVGSRRARHRAAQQGTFDALEAPDDVARILLDGARTR